MSSKPVVMLFAPDDAGIAQTEGLSVYGFDCRYFRDQHALYTAVQGRDGSPGTAVVLMGKSAENRNTVFYLRTTQARLGLLAQLRTGSEEEQIDLIQAGVDWIYPVGASCGLVATMLLSLWNRPRSESSTQMSAATRRHEGWILAEYAWILQDPQGLRVRLTSSERAVLLVLFDAPDLSATHEVLLAAVNQARNLPPGAGLRTRLSVLMSRLRSKCRRQGMDLPIRVIHNLGYMFAAQGDAS